jgi:hypothetical protein
MGYSAGAWERAYPLARFCGRPPDWGCLSDKTEHAAGAPDASVRLMDPHDGTRDYLKGGKKQVSTTFVANRRPVYGYTVVLRHGARKDLGRRGAAARPDRRSPDGTSS